jgi:hypothetical protein
MRDSSHVPENARVTGWGLLHPPDLEVAYRAYDHRERVARMRWILALTAIGHAAFASADLHFLAPGLNLYAILTTRGLMVVGSICLIAVLPRSGSEGFDRLVAVWTVCLGLSLTHVVLTRPADFLGHGPIDVAVVFAIYAFIPAPFAIKVAAAGALTLSDMALFAWVKVVTDPVTPGNTMFALAAANILGLAAERQLRRQRRALYLAARREGETKDRLARALARANTLRGRFPTCVRCAKVRADDEWMELALYVSQHSEASFTRDVCPACKFDLAENETRQHRLNL